MGPVQRSLRARLGDGRGLTAAEARQLGTLAGVLFKTWQRRNLLVLRADQRWHLRERLLGDEARAALEARAEREAVEAVARAASDAERERAERRAAERRAVLAELRRAKTPEEARRIATEHRALAIAQTVAEKLALAPETLTDPEIEALFGIEIDSAA